MTIEKSELRTGDEQFIRNVCLIFEELTGMKPRTEVESTVITYWQRKGWKLTDFRQMIEHHLNDPRQMEFLSKPGNLTLRMMFNPAHEQRLSDTLCQLVNLKLIQKIQETRQKSGVKTPVIYRLRMRCGEKIFREDYTPHLEHCFRIQGRCFFS